MTLGAPVRVSGWGRGRAVTQNDPRRTCQDKWEGLQKGCYNEHHRMNLGTPARVSGRGCGRAVTTSNTE